MNNISYSNKNQPSPYNIQQVKVNELIELATKYFINNEQTLGYEIIMKIIKVYPRHRYEDVYVYKVNNKINHMHFIYMILDKINYKLSKSVESLIIKYLIDNEYIIQLVNLIDITYRDKIFYLDKLTIEDIKRLQTDKDVFGDQKSLFYKKLFDESHILFTLPYYRLSTDDQTFYKILTKNNNNIRKYTHKYDTVINNGLRKGKLDSQAKEIVTKINELIDISPSFSDIILYRGITNDDQINIGQQYTDLGFSSKSLHPYIAQNFIKGNCCMLLFTYEDAAWKQLYLAYASEYPTEEEFISYAGEIYVPINYYNNYDDDGNLRKIYHCKVVGKKEEIVKIDNNKDFLIDELSHIILDLINVDNKNKGTSDSQVILINGHNNMAIRKTSYILYNINSTIEYDYTSEHYIANPNGESNYEISDNFIKLSLKQAIEKFYNDIVEYLYLELASDSCKYIDLLDFGPETFSEEFINDYLNETIEREEILKNGYDKQYLPRVTIIYDSQSLSD